MHFFISEASWSKPSLFLDHWGKPLFTLLSSPFSQFGYSGIIGFNILVFVFTVLVGWRILRNFNCHWSWSLAFPFLLLASNQYNITVLNGLTEPLFSLFLVSGMLFLQEKKWLLTALVIGCLPFLRSEGQLPFVLILAVLLVRKEFKYIALLFVPFIIYALVGEVSLGDPFWYFTRSPYHLANNIYGSGSYFHYLINWRQYFGWSGLVLLALGITSFLILLKLRKTYLLRWDIIVLAAGSFLGIIALHSYFWGSGKNGSLGLLRIATQGLPGFLLLLIYLIEQVRVNKQLLSSWWKIIPASLIILAIINLSYPTTPVIDEDLIQATQFVQKNKQGHQRLFFYHPLIGFSLKSNPFLKDKAHYQLGSKSLQGLPYGFFKYGDFLLWDSHFGKVEEVNPLPYLFDHPNFTAVNSMVESESAVWVFQYVPSSYKKAHPFDNRTTLANNFKADISNDEYHNLPSIKTKNQSNTYQLKMTTNQPCRIVVTADNSDYRAFEMIQGENEVSFTLPPNKNYSLYIWNYDKVKLSVSGELNLVEKVYAEVWTNR
jgi:hypothetical protein